MNKFEASVVSDLYLAGRQEDGVPFHAECFRVQVEAEDGRRWVHSLTLKGCRVEQDEEEGWLSFVDIRDEVRPKMERLAAKVNAHLAKGGKLDKRLWDERSPAYGSEAYINGGAELETIMWEKAQG
jgi:hypothetical protein